MSAHFVDRYLSRLGMAPMDVLPLTPASLERLVAAHVARIPFSNLHIHRGEIASTDPARIAERLVDGRGGGICYELNGGLGLLLEALGAAPRHLAGTVVMVDEDGSERLGPPLGHMACAVELDGRLWLADAGFGGRGIVRPDPADGDRVVAGPGAAYVLDGRPRPLADFVAMAWWHSTSPGSRFMGSLVVSVTEDGATRTLSGSGSPLRFALHDAGGRTPVDAAGARDLLVARFGLDDALPDAVVAYRPGPAPSGGRERASPRRPPPARADPGCR